MKRSRTVNKNPAILMTGLVLLVTAVSLSFIARPSLPPAKELEKIQSGYMVFIPSRELLPGCMLEVVVPLVQKNPPTMSVRFPYGPCPGATGGNITYQALIDITKDGGKLFVVPKNKVYLAFAGIEERVTNYSLEKQQ